MCSLLLTTSLVGGRWLNGSYCGLWCWTLNNTSADYNDNIGARPLV
uniref:Uncharacterized protein n=1 Tax=Siphoviridae sp. ctCVD13 TaxID=2826194 RepID=A0A8S5MFR7_9CAUD|nr:MAG TPA: hypothetical protein [Siphoviridae sp. ctCVD13]